MPMADSPIPPNIRAIFFDAVDTLIVPEPSVIEVYRNAGLEHGCDLSADMIVKRFREAFRSEEITDANAAWTVGEKRERQRWESIVSRVFDGCPAVDAIFVRLWAHFAQPDSWRVVESAGAVLSNLAGKGFVLGIASNFDARLNAIADSLPALAPLRLRVVSSEIGWRKPSIHFFEAVMRVAGCAAEQVLFIGDRRDTDYDGAIAAGLQAILLDPGSKAPPSVRRIRCLRELLSSSDFGVR
jgi:putative hydrolase of the HAD superfamily